MPNPKEYDCLVSFIQVNQEKLYRFAYGYVKDTALDVVQDAIVKALQKVHTLKHPEYLKTWFYRILINECLTYLRKSKRIISIEEMQIDMAEEDRYLEKVDASFVYEAIDRLPSDQKTIIMLRFFEDMKLEEIARATNTNLNTVKSRLYKALKRLKFEMQDVENC